MITGGPIKHIVTSSVFYLGLELLGLVLIIVGYFLGFPAWALILIGGAALVCYIIHRLLEKQANVKSL